LYIPINSQQKFKFQSPNYPREYRNNLVCEWKFVLGFPKPTAYVGSAVLDEVALNLSFVGLIFIENSIGCIYDSLEVIS